MPFFHFLSGLFALGYGTDGGYGFPPSGGGGGGDFFVDGFFTDGFL